MELRQVLRRFGTKMRDLPSVMAGLGVTEQEAHRVLNRLYLAGYVRRDPARPEELCWRRTPAGAAVAQAAVAPPLSRARAARLLQGVLHRVATINAKPYFLCRVTAVGVFGAYVTEAAVVDELDLVNNIAPKAPSPGTRDALFRPDRILPYWHFRRKIRLDDWSEWRARHVERSARVTCVQDVGVLSITGKGFNKIVEANASVASRLLRELARRIRTGNDNVVRKLEEQHYAIETRFLKLHRLIEASKIINSTLDLEKLLEVILDTAINALDADRGTLYLVDKAKNELWSKVWQGVNVVEIRLPIGKGVAGHVAQTGKTINITDAYNDPHFNPEIDLKTGYRTNNILCMPLRNKDGTTIGVFQLLNKQQGAFDDDDEQFIEALSAPASVALENARLAKEMVQNERLSAVGRMASTIIHDIKNPPTRSENDGCSA